MSRLIDADKLFPDVMKVDGSMAISQGQLAHAHTVEAIPKADYEARLKADIVAMLKELKKEIEELDTPNNSDAYMTCAEVIQQKIINELKENK